MLGIISGLDGLLGTRGHFLLGGWLEAARRWARSDKHYTATCDVGGGGKRTACSTGAFVQSGRVCGGEKVRLGRTVAPQHRPPTLSRIHEHVRWLVF